MAGLLQGLWELGKSFCYSHKSLSKAQRSIFLLPLTSKILTPHFLSRIHALATSVTFLFFVSFILLDYALQVSTIPNEHLTDIALSIVSFRFAKGYVQLADGPVVQSL